MVDVNTLYCKVEVKHKWLLYCAGFIHVVSQATTQLIARLCFRVGPMKSDA